jgi:GNAT superfamily N-acetyltransferase
LRLNETLKDGTKLLIRGLINDDLEKLMKFYRSLPYDDRKYLRIDVTDKGAVEKRISDVQEGKALRIIALHQDAIAAIGALEIAGDVWRRKLGELRVVVSRKFQRKGLGMIMIRELYMLAGKHNVEKVVAKMMRPQTGARRIFRKLGFHEELFLPDYVRDLEDNTQDLVIMTCDMSELNKELEFLYKESDFQRCR